MAFDPVSRTLFNQDGSDLNRQVASEITKIETEAAAIRKRGGEPVTELAPVVNQLRAAVELARFETVEQIRAIHDTARQEWEKARDKKPQIELAALQRSANRFKGMDDTSVIELAMSYANGEAELSYVELNEVRARLRSLPDAEAELLTLNDSARVLRADSPWISQDPEMSGLADYADELSSLTGSKIIITAESDGEVVKERYDLGDLIDYHDEMSAPDTGDV